MNDHLHQINNEFSDLVSDITSKTLKVGAILRLLQHRFDYGHDADISRDDMGALVELCLDTLPRDYQDIYDPLEKLSDQYDLAARESGAQLDKMQATSQIRHSAMVAIANPDTTVDELAEAGTAIYQLAQAIPEHEADWKTWVECVEARGYTIGFLHGPGDSKKLHLIAAKQGNLRKNPSLDSDLHIISERLSADDIEQISNGLPAMLRCILINKLSMQPEPIAQQDKLEV